MRRLGLGRNGRLGGNSTAIFVSGYSEPENLGDEARGQGRDPDCLFKYTSLPQKRLCHCSKITKESARSLSNLWNGKENQFEKNYSVRQNPRPLWESLDVAGIPTNPSLYSERNFNLCAQNIIEVSFKGVQCPEEAVRHRSGSVWSSSRNSQSLTVWLKCRRTWLVPCDYWHPGVCCSRPLPTSLSYLPSSLPERGLLSQALLPFRNCTLRTANWPKYRKWELICLEECSLFWLDWLVSRDHSGQSVWVSAGWFSSSPLSQHLLLNHS